MVLKQRRRETIRTSPRGPGKSRPWRLRVNCNSEVRLVLHTQGPRCYKGQRGVYSAASHNAAERAASAGVPRHGGGRRVRARRPTAAKERASASLPNCSAWPCVSFSPSSPPPSIVFLIVHLSLSLLSSLPLAGVPRGNLRQHVHIHRVSNAGLRCRSNERNAGGELCVSNGRRPR